MRKNSSTLIEPWRILIIVVSGICILVGARAFMGKHDSTPDKAPVHIAVALPFTGPSRAVGISFKKGIDMAVDQSNRNGGINGHPIKIDLYDDRGKATEAAAAAERITKDNMAVAVIGHSFSSCCLAAGPIYTRAGIPAITGQATNAKVTRSSKWYFRALFNDNFQGRFLTSFISKLTDEKNISIISEDLAYGRELAEVIRTSARQNGLSLRYHWTFSVNAPDLDRRLDEIAGELYNHIDAGIIIVACHTTQGTRLIKALKDAGINNRIVVPHTFDSRAFLHSFDSFPRERARPGYYTNGIYVSSPMIFASANGPAQHFRRKYTARYHEEPEWRAAYGYDTTMVIVEALKRIKTVTGPDSITKIRGQIRKFLASINRPEKAIEGVTGLNYFDEYGDAVKPVSIGLFSSRTTVPAPIQLQAIRQAENPAYLFDQQMKGDIIAIERLLLHKTRVVYTGVNMRRIWDIDTTGNRARLDFDIWFRYRGAFDTSDLEFTNAAERIVLDRAVKEEFQHGVHYRRFRVQGLFLMNFRPDYNRPGLYETGFSLHHTSLAHHNLILVSDNLGMGLDCQEANFPPVPQTPSDWQPQGIFTFQDVKGGITLGTLDATKMNSMKKDFSTYNIVINLKPHSIDLFPVPSGHWQQILFFGGIWFCIAALAITGSDFEKRYRPASVILSGIGLFLLFATMRYVTAEAQRAGIAISLPLFEWLWILAIAFMVLRSAQLFFLYPARDIMKKDFPSGTYLFVFSLTLSILLLPVICYHLEPGSLRFSVFIVSGTLAFLLLFKIRPADMMAALRLKENMGLRPGADVRIKGYGHATVMDTDWHYTRFSLDDGAALSMTNSRIVDSPPAVRGTI